MCQPAVAIVGIIFGSIVLGLTLTFTFVLIKAFNDSKLKTGRCNGNCQCRGRKLDDESGMELPPYNDENASASHSGASVADNNNDNNGNINSNSNNGNRVGEVQETMRLLDDDALNKN